MAGVDESAGMALPAPAGVTLPISGPPFSRPDPALIAGLEAVSSATASAILHQMGVRQTFIQGPLPRQAGAKVVGPAVTLQFMPQREDVASGFAQESSREVQRAVGGAGGDPGRRCAGYPGLRRSLHRLPGRDADHLFQGPRRRGHRGGWLHPRLAQGAGDRLYRCGRAVSRPTTPRRPACFPGPTTCRSPAAACWCCPVTS